MKKRVLLSILIFIGLIALTGCGSKKTITCSSSSELSENVTITRKSTITYKDDKVLNVETKEVFKSKSTDYLDAYKTAMESSYKSYDDLDNYEYKIKLDDDELITITNINYEKMDLTKFIKADGNNSSIIKDGRVSKDKLIKVYEENQMICK